MNGEESKAPDHGRADDGGTAPKPGPARLAPGLHFVATPIGAARDITLRALDILRCADVIAAEDTRTARKLMEIHGIALGSRPLLAYHDHNGAAARPKVLAALAAGQVVAYISEAGTPLVADPGFQLGRSVIEAGHRVWAAPGASAVLAALCVSGLASDRFLFAGFPPPQSGARQRWLAGLDAAEATIIIYESPKRVHRLLAEICDKLGPDREIALCRELTKRFEEVLRGTSAQVMDAVTGRTLKGEIVLVIDRQRKATADAATMEQALRAALDTMSVKAAASEVSATLGLPRRDVYQAALRLQERDR